jgi:hypothetical protein
MALEIIGAVIWGAVIGLIDIGFMISDLSGDAKSTIMHGLSSMIYIIALTFAALNIEFIVGMGLPSFLSNQYLMLTILGLLAIIVVHAKSAVFSKARGPGTHERWAHSLVIGILVAGTPYIWPYLKTFLPF